jgi:hypothetical protein
MNLPKMKNDGPVFVIYTYQTFFKPDPEFFLIADLDPVPNPGF